jgi:hypothetical protein
LRVHRADPHLNDAIAALDVRLSDAKRAMPKSTHEDQIVFAWTLLSPLELEFIKDEIGRCITDRIWYLSNYHVIQTEQGILTCLHPLFDLQWIVENALVKNLELDGQSRILVQKPRQAGITEYCNAVMCWRTFLVEHAYTMSVAQDPGVAAHVQRKIIIAHTNLPWWMRPEIIYQTKGEFLELGRKDVASKSTDPGLGSVFVTTHAQRSTGAAIGRTVRSLHMTEMSRWASSEIWSGDIEPSMNAPDTVAFGESTPFGNEGLYFNMVEEAREGDSDWSYVFLPTYRAKKFSLPIKPSQQPFVLTDIEQKFTDRIKKEEKFQITNEFWNWRRRRIKSSIRRTGFWYAHAESYAITPEEGFQSSGQGAFPRHKLDEQQQANVQRPLWVGEIGFQGINAAPKLLLNKMTDDHGNYLDIALEKRELTNRLYVWEEPDPRESYYLSADVGDGIQGGDFSVGEIIRCGYGNLPDVQVAEWVGYEPPEAFARILYALGFWYGKAEAAVEYAREGMTTAHTLATTLEYPNIYRPRREDKVGNQLMTYLHWQTTPKTKPLLLSKMNETLLEDGIVIRSQYCLDELRRCVKDGMSFSGLGGHDDSAVAITIGLYCLRQTMPELRQPAQGDGAGSSDGHNQSPTRSARASGGGVVYGIYDPFFRLRAQTRDLAKAQAAILARPGWGIKPIPISRANTAYSVIHHGMGLEHELYQEGGMNSWDITPTVVSRYAEVTGRATQHGVMPQFQDARPAGVPVAPAAQLSARVPLGSYGESEFWTDVLSGNGQAGRGDLE